MFYIVIKSFQSFTVRLFLVKLHIAVISGAAYVHMSCDQLEVSAWIY